MASDIRDILALGAASAPQTPSATSTIRQAAKVAAVSNQAVRKSDALNRELLQLTGGVPPLIEVKRKYKARPNFTKKQVARWVWKEFNNPARTDQLRLKHWVKADDVEEYYFAKFNKSVDVPTPTDDEYEQITNDIAYTGDDAWTKEETVHLYSLCKTYDLRWHVIMDRFESSRPRSMEELKDRYYMMTRHLLQLRDPTADVTPYAFPLVHEVTRKHNLVKLYSRTPAQIQEEEYLYTELRKREAREEKLLADREALLGLLRKYETENAIPVKDSPPPTDKKKTVRKAPKKPDEPVTAREPEPAPATPVFRKPPAKRTSTRTESEEPSAFLKKFSPGVYARSTKLPAKSSKVEKMFVDLGLPMQPEMPTAAVCNKYAELVTNVNLLYEAKKTTDGRPGGKVVATPGAPPSARKRTSTSGPAGTPRETKRAKRE
ncbi:swr complex subunit [Gaertneriomyces sp. JEL0708]|nr:swr complex subunit [Gaertneriomyces sp. JEL0708]